MEAAGYKMSPIWINYYMGAWSAHLYEKASYLLNYLVPSIELCREMPTSTVVRTIGAFCLGFSTTKTRVFLDFVPPYPRAKALKDSLAWWKKHMGK